MHDGLNILALQEVRNPQYYVVYDKVEWTVAEVTTSDVFLFLCRRGYLAVVRLLLEFKANPSCADNEGWTPLHHTCWYVPGADY